MGVVAIVIGLILFVVFISMLTSCFVVSGEIARLEEEMEKVRVKTEKHNSEK